jgi:hypothetical protein
MIQEEQDWWLISTHQHKTGMFISVVIPQRPCDFKWQPSAQVSRNIWYSAVAMYQRSSVHLGPAPCPFYIGQTAHIIYYPRSGLVSSYLYAAYWHVISAWEGPQEYWHLHHSDCRNTLINIHSPHLWHEPRLTKCSCACSWRLCEITWTLLITSRTIFFPDIYEYSIRTCRKYWHTCF